MKQIYPWQEAALQKWEDSGYHGIFDVVTGAGKTCLALFGIQKLKSFLTLPLAVFVVVPTHTLMEQWAREIRLWFPGESIGGVCGRRKCSDQLSFQIFIVNSARTCLSERRNKLLSQGNAVLLVADECHHYGSMQNRKIFGTESAAYYTMGLSATPFSTEYPDILYRHLGNCVFSYRHPQALRDHIISGFCLYQIGLNFYGKEAKIYGELSDRMAVGYSRLIKQCPQLKDLPQREFFSLLRRLAQSGENETAAAYYYLMLKRKDIVNQSCARPECAAELIRQLDPAARIIVFTERVAQADRFASLLQDVLPGSFEKVHSGRNAESNRRALREFREGNVRILITCKVLDEGMDVPDADAAIVLAGTAALRQHIQRLGRILRKSGTGKLAALYYLYLRESSEGGEYLPGENTEDKAGTAEDDEAPFRMHCSYYAGERIFANPVYEETAKALLDRLAEKKISKTAMNELRTCLMQGLMRPDWLREPEECEQRAGTEKEKENYWLAAKMMAGERLGIVRHNANKMLPQQADVKRQTP